MAPARGVCSSAAGRLRSPLEPGVDLREPGTGPRCSCKAALSGGLCDKGNY